MAQTADWFASNAPVAKADWFASNPPQPEQPGAIRRFVDSAIESNPITAAVDFLSQLFTNPKAAGAAIVNPSVERITRGNAAASEGRPAAALGQYAAAIPLIGPFIAQNVERAQGGDIAGALGALQWLASPAAFRAMTEGVTAVRPVVRSSLTPPEAASVAFGESRGIPMDLATKTGSRTARALQKRSANSIGGEGTAERMIAQQAEGLTRVGGQLAEQARPGSVTPEQAGEGVRGSVQKLMADLNALASESYGSLREMEANPRNASIVPKAVSATERKALETRQYASLGYLPDAQALAELRRMRAEMDAYGYEGRQWRYVGGNAATGELAETGGGKGVQGNAGGGQYEVKAGHAGAPVYDDILEAAPGTAKYTRSEVIRAIDSALETGQYTNIAKGALSVAERRAKGEMGGLSRPMLPPEAGDKVVPVESMAMAVDVGSIKPALKPIYDRLKREGELAPLMGGKADALRALDRLMNGPDHAPLSVADAALGDLKTLSRVDIPELRTQGQGIAAEAVKQLSDAVMAAARRAGPKAVQALEQGRSATVGKYQAGDVYETLPTEPVQAFRKLTAPKDSGIQFLRQVQELSPAKMPDVARAYLDDLLGQATERGRFEHTDRLYAEWQKLGPQTKRILFPDEGHREALDQFFLLAKRMGENPNPSGTAHTLSATNLGSSVVTYPLAKLLYTEAGVKALTNRLNLSELAKRMPAVNVARRAGSVTAKAGRLTQAQRLAAEKREGDEDQK